MTVSLEEEETQRHTEGTQGEDGHVQAEDRGLGRKPKPLTPWLWTLQLLEL